MYSVFSRMQIFFYKIYRLFSIFFQKRPVEGKIWHQLLPKIQKTGDEAVGQASAPTRSRRPADRPSSPIADHRRRYQSPDIPRQPLHRGERPHLPATCSSGAGGAESRKQVLIRPQAPELPADIGQPVPDDSSQQPAQPAAGGFGFLVDQRADGAVHRHLTAVKG